MVQAESSADYCVQVISGIGRRVIDGKGSERNCPGLFLLFIRGCRVLVPVLLAETGRDFNPGRTILSPDAELFSFFALSGRASNTCQYLSILVNTCQYFSILFNRGWPTLVSPRLRLPHGS
jgi:hypothetical protein